MYVMDISVDLKINNEDENVISLGLVRFKTVDHF